MQDKCERVNPEQTKTLLQKIPDAEIITRMSAVFQALQSDTRLKILFFTQAERDVCM